MLQKLDSETMQHCITRNCKQSNGMLVMYRCLSCMQELSYPANSLSSMVVISAHLSTGTNAGRPVRCIAARNIADALAYGILRKLWSFCGLETVGLPNQDCVVLSLRSCNLRISTPRSYTTTSRFATIA